MTGFVAQQTTQCSSIRKRRYLLLYWENVTVGCKNDMEHTNTLREQKYWAFLRQPSRCVYLPHFKVLTAYTNTHTHTHKFRS